MPTVLLFFSSDRVEPRHIHVKRDRQIAKFWLEPIALARNAGFTEHELREIERLVHQHQALFVRAWNEFSSA
jgi:uncharacterized protein DUF4160